MLFIESSTNSKIKKLKSLKTKKVRDTLNLFFVEGQKMIDEAILSSFTVVEIYISESYYKKNIKYIENLESHNILIYKVSDFIIESISNTVSPQGIIAIIEKNEFDIEQYINNGVSILLLDKINDPGNLGTIIRTADAFNIPLCFYTRGSVDIYNDKTIRATMGSIFRVSYIEVTEKYLNLLKENKYQILGMSINGKTINETKLKKKCVIAIGNEASGISNEILEICDRKISIKMIGKTESLNAAISAAIIMYEISKL